jgi:hypothetical protein
VIIPGLGLDLGKATISECTAQAWLHKLGYALTEAQKGKYVDGHERDDVIAYRKELLHELATFKQYLLFSKK